MSVDLSGYFVVCLNVSLPLNECLIYLLCCVSVSQEVVAHWKAECGLAIDSTLLLTLHSAHTLGTLGSRTARKQLTHT